MPADPHGINRRQFLERTGRGLALGGVALPLLLEACTPAAPAAPSGGGQPAGGAGASQAAVKLPTYMAFQGPKPDLPGNPQGLDPAYFKFPAELIKSVPTPPGDGSTVSAITYLTLAPPPPMDQNAAWQAVNKALNATLTMEMPSATDYPARVSVVIAGNDLPDFIYNPNTQNPMGAISGLPQFLAAKCSDLTPYLSGDAVKDYPNLANFSSYTWRSGVISNKIYAIPVARPPIGTVMMWRPDLFEKAGLQMDKAPQNADDFKRMLQAVTRPQENQWGIAAGAASYFGLVPNSAFSAIFRVPNNWKLDAGGKLIKDCETEEFKAAVGFARDLWQLGVWHPNTPTYGGVINPDFVAGRFAVLPGVWGQYVQLWDIGAASNPSAKVYPMQPWAADGGTPWYHAGTGNFGVTYIKQQPNPDRLKMLLRIANFFAAPFGTQEWLLNYFGVKDVDFTFNQAGAPALTEQGRSELTVVWRYVASPAYALFSGNRSQDFATVSHAAEEAMMASMQLDPTLGLFSQTALSQGISAQDQLYGGVSDIVQGRRPLADLDSLVAEWRSRGGDKMRAEFQDALDQAKKAGG